MGPWEIASTSTAKGQSNEEQWQTVSFLKVHKHKRNTITPPRIRNTGNQTSICVNIFDAISGKFLNTQKLAFKPKHPFNSEQQNLEDLSLSTTEQYNPNATPIIPIQTSNKFSSLLANSNDLTK